MKQVLLIGLNPYTLDFSLPGFPEGMTAEKVIEGIRSEQEKLTLLGYNLDTHLPDLYDPKMEELELLLQEKNYEAIIIGAGIRLPPSIFLLFEKFINAVHAFAPKARIIFNSKPDDNVTSVERWI